ncbi:hypothetical protein HCU62_04740, partial [Dissulfurirhabdus thermomarina]|nr:hypothetical protein [Dissulfurirhabdus thermomarina]
MKRLFVSIAVFAGVAATASLALADDNHPNGGIAPTGPYVVMATNDLGMHCACPGAETFLLLPPFNTLRAQVIQRDKDPKVIADPSK